ncbi:NAD(P)H-dependent flavin oxidoreductase [Streptomyces nanshensis]|uniref:2-nitropropane dioxygenase n=1 Tax=Streptomyces nanshensis TaxID=518642 RepID=A0A1E7KWP8_9ACTN|nr:nitronate monooxygenase [Streptomyces nanshensis]OEV08352.1 2-nitropropane dioxygenase [Streptomyces nanshensis]
MTPLRTGLCELLGIAVPVVQAPVGRPCTPALAAAVSNAGGLGMLACTWDGVGELAARVRATQAATAQPFGVNLLLEWDQEERIEECLALGVGVISTGWGDPAPLTARIHRGGALHLHTVGSAAEARHAADAGVDVVVAQGWEAGGHVCGGIASLPLVPAVVDAVAPVPVVGAGGVADGRGLAAMLALGAQAAWIGTRFLLAEEAATAPAYRAGLARAEETDTVHGVIFDKGWPRARHRALVNSTVEVWRAAGRPPVGERPGEDDVLGHGADGAPIERYADVAPTADVEGDAEAMALYAGQSVGLVGRRQPAAAIVAELEAEAVRSLDSLRGMGG